MHSEKRRELAEIQEALELVLKISFILAIIALSLEIASLILSKRKNVVGRRAHRSFLQAS